jgi:hypothetical protein
MRGSPLAGAIGWPIVTAIAVYNDWTFIAVGSAFLAGASWWMILAPFAGTEK